MKIRTASLWVLATLCVLCRPVPAAGIPELTPAERAQRLQALPAEDRQWLTDYVAPIVLPAETNLFLQLTEPHERETFREEFWARRERPGLAEPLGPGYRSRYEHLREVAVSDYDGLSSDAGRLVVRRGEPASIAKFQQCDEIFRQVEVWTYTSAAGGIRKETHSIFYRPSLGAPRKLWYPAIPERELLVSSACVTSIAAACKKAGAFAAAPGASAQCPNPGSATGCEGDTVRG